jgi:hypothetical protein
MLFFWLACLGNLWELIVKKATIVPPTPLLKLDSARLGLFTTSSLGPLLI